jgi:hypothetical protein
MGEGRYIGLLDCVFGVGVVAENAAGNSIKAPIMCLHN